MTPPGLRISADLLVRRVSEADADLLLQLYRQCEDFLALGPTPKASLELVLTDIQHSAAEGGQYWGIWRNESLCGVIDWTLRAREAPFISLLMLARNHRGMGIGGRVLAWLESQIARDAGHIVETAVQTNNPAGMRFWLRHGYDVVHGPIHNDDGTTVVILRKRLRAICCPCVP